MFFMFKIPFLHQTNVDTVFYMIQTHLDPRFMTLKHSCCFNVLTIFHGDFKVFKKSELFFAMTSSSFEKDR